MSKKLTKPTDWLAPRYGGLPSHYDFREASQAAFDMGASFGQVEQADLVRSRVYANEVLPELRAMCGYQHHDPDTAQGAGSYWTVPDIDGMTEDQVTDELSETLDELLEVFWDGHDTACPDDIALPEAPPTKPTA